MWVNGLDTGLHECVCRTEPCSAIVGDDGVGFADDRGVDDVAVIGIIEPVAAVAVLGCVNLGTRKRPLQLVEGALSATGAIADPAFVVQVGEYVVQLQQNPRPPKRRLGLLGRQL